MIKDDQELIRIWKQLRKQGEFEGITLPPNIRDSWERCKQLNVDHRKHHNDKILNSEEFQERIARNKVLVEQATTSMEDLYKITEGSGFFFILADRDGYILKRIGDKKYEFSLLYPNHPDFVVEGSKWTEDVMGTNGIGTTIVERRPMQVFAYEHYCVGSLTFTSSVSPIFDADQNLIGVLCITGPYYLANHHTLGMAVAAARAIERQMILLDSYQRIETENMNKNIIMESVFDGVLTLDQNLKVLYSNKLASEYLGINQDICQGRRLKELLLPGNESFLTKISENQNLWNEPILVNTPTEPVRLTMSSTPLISSYGTVIGKVVVIQTMKRYRRMVERAIGAQAIIDFEQIVGRSHALAGTVKLARAASTSNSSVLLLGESGTGKEMFAQAIHKASSRSKGPFFAINCAALPRELVSSELFGYEEGAFTGAKRGGNPGKFELADQGTLFLDEIGEMPLDIQATLLRVLEEGTIVRLGGKEQVPVNVRIVAASNKNLAHEVRKGKFRLDLYYRLGVVVIGIPPLRDRKEDIPALVEHFIHVIAQRLGREVKGIENQAMEKLISYQWPGNVRELSNVIERAINLAPGPILTLESLGPELTQSDDLLEPWEQTISMYGMEEAMIKNYLKKYHNNKTRVARELGISRSSLYRKMEKYQMN